MVRVHGFELRDMRSWYGMEGIGTQGRVFLNGQELGFWSCDGNGGIVDRFEFDANHYDRLLKEQFPNEYPNNDWDFGSYPDALQNLLSFLADMTEESRPFENVVIGSPLVVA